MKCHYELLEVSRDADDDTIKKSYRKLALKWHPDKNPDNVEQCTQLFALIQQAYDVLSDAHERAFYDRHRESILKGGFDADEKQDSLDVFHYFTSSCYKGYDGDKGFYSVYKNVFDTLSNEDYDFIDDPAVRYPTFGDADSDYDKIVGPFYGFWSAFSTARSFAWLEKYDIRQASNRFESRAIEAENKKFRAEGKAERNEQIRELVSFVRKRDPRVKAYRDLLEEKRIEAQKKQEEHRLAQLLKNRDLANQYVEDPVAAAAHRAHLREILADHTDESCDEEENEAGEQLPYCIACEKSFRTQNQLLNHENSKQHKKQLAELRRHMKEEDAMLFSEEDEPVEVAKKGKKAKRRAKKKKAWDSDASDAEEGESPELSTPVGDVADALAEVNLDKLTKDGAEQDEEKIEADPVPVNLFLAAAQAATAAPDTNAKTKKKRRADKKKEDDVEETVEDLPNPDVHHETGPKTDSCQKCGEFFESRSRLFEHLKQSGHATLKGAAPPPPKNKKGKRKGNKDDDF